MAQGNKMPNQSTCVGAKVQIIEKIVEKFFVSDTILEKFVT